MQKVFIDTSALYAILDIKDANHKKAGVTYKILLSSGTKFTLTDHILSESLTLIRRRLGYKKSLEFSTIIQQGEAVELFNIVFVDRPAFRLANQFFEQMKSVKISYVDCLSFATMNIQKISDCFAYDKHFREAGFNNIEDSLS